MLFTYFSNYILGNFMTCFNLELFLQIVYIFTQLSKIERPPTITGTQLRFMKNCRLSYIDTLYSSNK